MKPLLLASVLFMIISPLRAQDSTARELQIHQIKDEIRKEYEADLEKMRSELTRKLDMEKESLRLDNRKTTFSIGAILTILTIIGISSFLKLKDSAVEKAKASLHNAIYRVDPTYIPIRMNKTDMAFEYDLLRKMDFRRIKLYKDLDERINSGVIIYKASDDESVKDLLDFITTSKLADDFRVIFIIYTTLHLKEFDAIKNVIFANKPLTLIQALFVAQRGLLINKK